MKKILLTTVLFATHFLLQAQSGTLDTTFQGSFNTSASQYLVYDVKVLSNDKILVGGGGSSTIPIIFRLDSNGVLDNTFSLPVSSIGNFSGGLNVITVQPDGKILIGGNIYYTQSLGSGGYIGLLRLNADGSEDTTFPHLMTNVNAHLVKAIALQPDGKIIVGGAFLRGVERFNADGTLDTTFNVGGDGIVLPNQIDGVRAVALQPDGKILIGGNFQKYNGDATKKYFLRLNNDGTIDSTFNMGAGALDIVNTITVSPIGKIIIGGRFTKYSGLSLVRIARINADGTPDTTFNPAAFVAASISGANDEIFSLYLQVDGKIVIGGSFKKYNNNSRNGLTRINADGSIDYTFNVGTGLSRGQFVGVGYANALTAQSDGKLLVGGEFISYNNISAINLIRLNSDDSLSINEVNENNITTVYPNPANSILNIKLKETTNIKIVNMLGETVSAQKLNAGNNRIDVSLLARGIYFIQSSNGGAVKFIKE